MCWRRPTSVRKTGERIARQIDNRIGKRIARQTGNKTGKMIGNKIDKWTASRIGSRTGTWIARQITVSIAAGTHGKFTRLNETRGSRSES